MKILHSTTLRIGFAALCAAALLAGCGDDRPPAASPGDAPAVHVETTAAASAFPVRYEAAGSVAAERRVKVASRIPAYITAVNFREGDLVREGDLLAALDSTDALAAVHAAEGKLAAARAAERDAEIDLKKFEALAAEGFISDLELRRIRLKRDAAAGDRAEAEGAVRRARNQLRYVDVRSPLEGRVAERLKEPGELAVPGLPILILDSLRNPKFEAGVPAAEVDGIRPGDEVEVAVEGRLPLKGSVESVAQSAAPGTRTYLVRIALPKDADVRPGAFGRASFRRPDAPSAAVPESALTRRGGLDGVFVVEEGRTRFAWVRIGRRCAGLVEILAGLRPGESVVLQPSDALRDGARVEVTHP